MAPAKTTKREYRKPTEVTSPAGVASFPYINKPDTGGQYSDDKFKVTVTFPADTIWGAVDNAERDEAIAEWQKLPKTVGKSYHEVEETDDAKGLVAGTFVMRAKSKFRPAIYDASRKLLWNATMGDELPKEARFYPGDLIKVRVAMVANTAGGNKQVSPRLLAVQIIERRGGGNDADYADAFDDEGDEQGSITSDTLAADPEDGNEF